MEEFEPDREAGRVGGHGEELPRLWQGGAGLLAHHGELGRVGVEAAWRPQRDAVQRVIPGGDPAGRKLSLPLPRRLQPHLSYID